eukprot:6650489-Prorocentrum_lima.AAC.1
MAVLAKKLLSGEDIMENENSQQEIDKHMLFVMESLANDPLMQKRTTMLPKTGLLKDLIQEKPCWSQIPKVSDKVFKAVCECLVRSPENHGTRNDVTVCNLRKEEGLGRLVVRKANALATGLETLEKISSKNVEECGQMFAARCREIGSRLKTFSNETAGTIDWVKHGVRPVEGSSRSFMQKEGV